MKNRGGSRQVDSRRCVVGYMVNRRGQPADGDAFMRSCILSLLTPNGFTAVCCNLTINLCLRVYTQLRLFLIFDVYSSLILIAILNESIIANR